MPDSEMARNFFFSQATATAPAEREASGEEQLVERACSGDGEAFNEFYRMFAPLVHGIVLARVPYDDVKDIVQEVFLAAYKNLDGLRDKNAVGAWLAKIARNHAAEYYRKARPTEELSEDLSGKHNPKAEAVEIMRTIRSMPETYRETLVLRLIEGLTGNEIAERTGLTPESVRVNLHRGMDQLRQKLGIEGVKR